jgi:hypothetical protein
MSLDMAYVADQAVLAVCHKEADGRVALDRMHVWKGSRIRPIRERDVEETVLEARRAYRNAPLIVDPWQTKGMAQRLRQRGVSVTEFVFSQQSVGRIALTLSRALRDHAVMLPDDEPLLTELARVQLREVARARSGWTMRTVSMTTEPSRWRCAPLSSSNNPPASASATLSPSRGRSAAPTRTTSSCPSTR